jgi:hypothetical protein
LFIMAHKPRNLLKIVDSSWRHKANSPRLARVQFTGGRLR